MPIDQLAAGSASLVSQQQQTASDSSADDPADAPDAVASQTDEADEEGQARRHLQSPASLGMQVEEPLVDQRPDDVLVTVADLASEPCTHRKGGVQEHHHRPDRAWRGRIPARDQPPCGQHGKHCDQPQRQVNEVGV